jgi:hypothetical protein
MNIQSTAIKRAASDLLRFNSKDFNVQASQVGFGISVLQPPKDAQNPTGPTSFSYGRDGLSSVEILFPLGVAQTMGRDYPDLAAATAALSAMQTDADALAVPYYAQAVDGNSWYANNAALTVPPTVSGFPPITSPGFSVSTPRSWFGLPGVAIPTRNTPTCYAYKSSSIFSTRLNSSDTRCAPSCAVRSVKLRLTAFVKESGAVRNFRVGYAIERYAEDSFWGVSGITLRSRTLVSSTPGTFDISIGSRLGMYNFTFPELDVISLPWPVVPALPASSGGSFRSENRQTKLALSLTSIIAI